MAFNNPMPRRTTSPIGSAGLDQVALEALHRDATSLSNTNNFFDPPEQAVENKAKQHALLAIPPSATRWSHHYRHLNQAAAF